ncbi:hypothetical protein [Sphingomonas sp. GM_Shp_2]|uniref:hypothetical protein n=1 Tax=Sphingomonas sp. GM_Shp_2 TaxID=2937380 RepID=UPI00226AD2C6|nr:hypothetical protein [Sphingomonas sp. GM_Shp_2]
MIDRHVQILEGARGQQPITTVSALRDIAHLVLLGEPGIGKTTVLEGEAAVAGAAVIKVRELINETVTASTATLFLDGLDEFRMGASDLAKVDELVRAIQRSGSVRWRLTCRAEDWKKAADIAAIKRSTGGAPVTVAQVLPLDLDEQLEVLEGLGVGDPDAFVSKAHALGATGLLESPLSLKLLHTSVIGGGAWPKTRYDLFESSTFALAHEDNDTHRLDRSRASAESILDAAAKICLVLLASGGRFVWRSGALPPSGDARAYLNAATLGIDRALIDDVLGSSLFRGEGEAFEPVHRTVAEFLGSRALAVAVRGKPGSAALPLGRALAAITANDGRAPTDLRGLYAWFAAHLARLGEARDARRLVEADAVSVLVYGDAAEFNLETKRELLANLDRHGPYFRAAEVGVTAVGGLACEALATELADALQKGDGTHRMLTVFEVLTAGSPVLSLQPMLREIALDPSREEWQRVRAMTAWLSGGGDVNARRRELFDALGSETPSGARESMRAELLAGLPADLVTIEDIQSVVAAFATAPGDSTILRLFGLRLALEDNPRSELFDAPFDWLPPEGARRHSYDVLDFVDHALAAAIRATPDVCAERLWGWLANSREDRLDGVGELTRAAVKAWREAEPGRDVALFEAMLAEDDPNEGPWMAGTYYGMIGGEPNGAILDRLTDLAQAEKEERQDRLLAIATSIGRRSPVGADAYWRLYAYLESMPDAELRVAALSTVEVEDWRLKQARAERHNIEERTRKRGKELDTLRQLAPSMAAGANSRALEWAANIYFHPRDKHEEALTPIERLSAATDPAVLDAVLAGWHYHASTDISGITPMALGEVEAARTHYYSEYAAIAGLHRMLDTAVPPEPAALPLTLAIIVLRTGWIVKLTDRSGRIENWAWERLDVDPEAGALALVAYWEAILKAGYVDSNAWHQLGSAPAGAAAAKALKQFLERHPSMSSKVLLPMLAAAGRHLSRDEIIRLAAVALTETLPDEPRAIWSLVAFATDPLTQSQRLDDHGIHLFALFKDLTGSVLLDAFGTGSKAEQIALASMMFATLAPEAGPAIDRSDQDASRIGTCATAMLTRLANDGSPDATDAIARLHTDLARYPAWEPDLRHTAEQQARSRRDREFLPPSAAALCELLEGKAPVNAADLRAIVTAELRRFGRELRTGPNSPWKDYWNTDKYEKATDPKVENVARDLTLNRLQDRLAKYQIAVTASEARRAEGTRADILVVSGAGRNLPVEAKRHYHADLWDAAAGQLQGYAADEGADGYGILLVFWYGDLEPLPARTDGAVPASAAELEELLAADLPPNLRAKTDIVVLDASAPERRKPKPAKAAGPAAGKKAGMTPTKLAPGLKKAGTSPRTTSTKETSA